MNPTSTERHLLLCQLGEQLSGDTNLYVEIRGRLQSAWKLKRTHGLTSETVNEYKLIADMVNLPGDQRELATLISDLEKIVQVARRFIARQKLAAAAGLKQFDVGMNIIRHNGGSDYILGTVVKLHPDGKFTFQAYGQKAYVADPCAKTTVEVIVEA